MFKKYCFFCMFPTFLQCAEYVVGEMMGQLGNQFFIIAATVALALDHNAEPLFPHLATETTENIPLNREEIFSHIHLNIKPIPVSLNYRYLEPYFHYAKIPYQSNMSINGYFQSEKYFLHHKKTIIDLFSPPKHILDYLNFKYRDIIQHPNTVAIHYRSYEREDPQHRFHASCDLDYYIKAISLFPEDSLFIVFSNDINWCKSNFKNISRPFIYIENEEHYHDIYFMSLCKHQIICNSSFSWWSAYLNLNVEKTVIAPSKWFNSSYINDTQDLIPPEWIIME